jgi:hypothetical protein
VIVTSRLLWVCIVVTSVALLLGCTLGGLWLWAPAVLGLTAFWLFGEWRRWAWVASAGLVLCAAMGAAGTALGLPAGWMLVSLVAALIAWDLSYFVSMLRSVRQVEGVDRLVRDHLRRLGLAAGLGLLLGAVALSVHTRLSFWAIFVLGLLGMWSLSRAVAFLRIETE